MPHSLVCSTDDVAELVRCVSPIHCLRREQPETCTWRQDGVVDRRVSMCVYRLSRPRNLAHIVCCATTRRRFFHGTSQLHVRERAEQQSLANPRPCTCNTGLNEHGALSTGYHLNPEPGTGTCNRDFRIRQAIQCIQHVSKCKTNLDDSGQRLFVSEKLIFHEFQTMSPCGPG